MALSNELQDQVSDFLGFGLDPRIVAAVVDSGYTTATPIQRKTIPPMMEGKDVLGQAQTGTGKTAAFALPLLHRIDAAVRAPQVLVLAPTRELAIQVSEAFEKYGAAIKGLRVMSICGGQNYEQQFRQLKGLPQVIVATPGRLIDLVQKGVLDLSGLRCVVLDEADEMLKMGFAEDVDWILGKAPKERQTALFSATMPDSIVDIANRHLNKPTRIVIAQKTATAETVRQRYVIAPTGHKESTLIRIAETEDFEAMLVFVKLKSSCEPIAEMLSNRGFRAAALNGDVAQSQRERIIDRLKSREIEILIATDVAARGLDVQHISHVVNFDLPINPEVYVHRIGRTGRAGRDGEAILFVGPYDRRKLKQLEHATRKPMEEMPIPTSRELNQKRVSRFHDRISHAIQSTELDNFQSIIDQYRRANPEVEVEKIAAALALMANGGKPLLEKTKNTVSEFVPDSQRGERRGGGGRRGFGGDHRGPRNYGSQGRREFHSAGDHREFPEQSQGDRGGESRERPSAPGFRSGERDAKRSSWKHPARYEPAMEGRGGRRGKNRSESASVGKVKSSPPSKKSKRKP
jgi:ATP-dependent RNA helicase DeaD